VLSAVSAAFFCLASCGDYLDIMPDNVATMEMAFSTRETAKMYLHTCYSYQPNPNYYTANPGILSGDESFWCLGTYGIQLHNNAIGKMYYGLQNVNDPYLNYWDGAQNGTNLWIAIRDCNIFFENIHLPTDLEDWERLQWISEVKFLKAYYHFYLLRHYGPIPLMKENIPVSSAEVQMYRDPVDDCVEYIVQLLDEAMPDLLPTSYDTRTLDAGRITQPICAALKAKVLVWAASPLLNGSEMEAPQFSLVDNRGRELFPRQYSKEKWTRAAEAVREAIEIAHTNGHVLYEYKPMNISTQLSDTTMLKCTLRGAVTDKYNTEIVWPCTFSTNDLQYRFVPFFDEGSASYNYGEIGPTLKAAEMYYSRNGLPLNEDAEWLEWNGSDYSKRYDTILISTTAGSGIDKVASLATDHNYYIKDGEYTARLHCYREPRFYAHTGFDRGYWELNGKGEKERYMKARNTEVNGWLQEGRHQQCGYFAKKLINMETIQASGGGITFTRYTYPYIRLTDLYLLMAEALNEMQGPSAEVYQWLDIVRARAGIPGVQEAYQKAIPSMRSKPTTKEGLREIIKRERLIELAFESQRFYDLLRWKDAMEYWNQPVQGWDISQKEPQYYYQVTTYFSNRNFTSRDYFWPLKLSSLQVNSNFVQNPGW
jgi:hypothetical protein